MKTLLSLFDYSGGWSQPFEDAGWNVIRWDIKLREFMDINLIDSAETAMELFEDADGILAAVPCTEMAISGARWWSEKELNRPWLLKDAIQLVSQVERLVDLFKPTDPDYEGTFFWAVENPVGRIGKVTGLGKAAMFFDPCDFAGWLDPTPQLLRSLDRLRDKDGYNVTPAEREFIMRSNAYTKYTGLWGEFNTDLVKKRIEPVKGAPTGSPTQAMGGKSDKTKELRSITPAGFAMAFYEANK